jgi:hypothetical protein
MGNAELTVLPEDKGNATVILNSVDYTEIVLALLDDAAHKKLAKQPIQSTEWKTTFI